MLYDKLYIRLCAVLQIVHNSTNENYIYIYIFGSAEYDHK